MEDLVSIKEIKKEGFKPETQSSYLKGKYRYLKCGNCGAWNFTTKQPDPLKKIKQLCEWCEGSFTIQLIKK